MKTLKILISLLIVFSSAYGQDLVPAFNHDDTIPSFNNVIHTYELTYFSDTTAIQIIYIDNLNYLKYAKGICIESGYRSDKMTLGWEQDYTIRYFIEEYIEIELEKIIITL